MECQYPSICIICDSSLEPDRAVLEDHIAEVVRATFGVYPKPKQVEVLYNLAFERVDNILIAKTGFGKSLISHALPAIVGHDGIALIIMPLLELEADQARKLTRFVGCRPFVLNADTNTRRNRRDIGAGKYTHVFASPEIALERYFAEGVLRVPEFNRKLCLLAIDEIHVVEEWSGFRPAYLQLARPFSIARGPSYAYNIHQDTQKD